MSLSSGFQHAPVTKALVAVTACCSVASTLFPRLPLALDAPSLLRGQLWRLFSHVFVFQYPGECFLGLLLLYRLRAFERRMGSSKFAAYALMVTGLGSVPLVALLASQPLHRWKFAGPYALVFATMARFFFNTPASYHFKIFGTRLSDKTMMYILGLQMLLAHPPASLVAGAAGIAAGMLYGREELGLEKKRLPSAITSTFKRWVLPIVQQGSSSSAATLRRSDERPATSPTWMAGDSLFPGRAGGAAGPMGRFGASEDGATMYQTYLSQLESMGFPTDQAEHALRTTATSGSYDLAGAADYLVGASSS